MNKPRFNPMPLRRHKSCDSRQRSLAIELLCQTFPTGAVVLDAYCDLLFSNREGSNMLVRWTAKLTSDLALKSLVNPRIPAEILGACHRLRQGDEKNESLRSRPKFGGRIFVRHPTESNMSAVVALERSARDRHVAVFCILLQDGLKSNLVAGRGDKLAMLTIAERRVAKLVAEGHRNSDIAAALGKSISTVKSQLMTVFSKLDIGSRTQLAALLRSS